MQHFEADCARTSDSQITLQTKREWRSANKERTLSLHTAFYLFGRVKINLHWSAAGRVVCIGRCQIVIGTFRLNYKSSWALSPTLNSTADALSGRSPFVRRAHINLGVLCAAKKAAQ
jgi:hypothetical protein